MLTKQGKDVLCEKSRKIQVWLKTSTKVRRIQIWDFSAEPISSSGYSLLDSKSHLHPLHQGLNNPIIQNREWLAARWLSLLFKCQQHAWYWTKQRKMLSLLQTAPNLIQVSAVIAHFCLCTDKPHHTPALPVTLSHHKQPGSSSHYPPRTRQSVCQRWHFHASWQLMQDSALVCFRPSQVSGI